MIALALYFIGGVIVGALTTVLVIIRLNRIAENQAFRAYWGL